ncbi:MAG: ATP-grasp domain-containing protein [Chitinophagales bacterium]|jgi:D-alanine-D-alanine ligase|nr:ATP-grasp domain-containing protein [Chitinophagales bacterium]
MKHLAIITGGFDHESAISMKSSEVVHKHIDTIRYHAYQIVIEKNRWYERYQGLEVDKTDFSIVDKGKKIVFDVAFIALHGAPAETGHLQGYLDMIGIPYVGCIGLTAAMTMDKALSKDLVTGHTNIKTAKYIKLKKNQEIPLEEIKFLGEILFVKPNSAGSSFGVTKVKRSQDIIPAIQEAWKHSEFALIEEFIQGREFSHGIYQHHGKTEILPITEIISQTEFFDFAAKYENKSQEITPAELDQTIAETIYEHSKKIFDLFQCRQMSRFDYLVRGNEVFFMEANTIPGLSEQSIYPQQLLAAGYTLSDAFNQMIEEAFHGKI